MMKTIIKLIGVVAVAGIVFWLVPRDQGTVLALNGKATPVHGQPGLFMVAMTLENEGTATTLTSVTSPSAEAVSIMNPGHMGDPLVIPADGSGVLAMDGAHIMLRTPSEDFSEGGFLPLTLSFDGKGDISTRIIHAGMQGMQHSSGKGISETPAPSVGLTLPNNIGGEGFDLTVDIQGLSLIETPDGTPHFTGQGHAHVYLNGLKLGRLYDETYAIGALPKGTYTLRVSLNANNHMPYMDGDTPISDAVTFTIP
ncbi:MAG: copper chaperone PCu(A)C [Boseongicola sp.]|nr:MAG: copper chaperone PCu(A)C [Boseongicola sp.]